MKTASILLLISLAGTLVLAQSDLPGISEKDLESLRENLADYGQTWLDTGQEDATVEILLDSVWYEEESLLLLRVALAAEYDDDSVDLYVTESLLRPLEYVETEVVAEALPIVGAQVERIGDYRKDLPKWTDQELSLMAQAVGEPQPGESATRQRQREQGQALLEQQDQAIRVTQLHNQKVHDLRMLYVRLLLLADTDDADETVLKLLAEALADNSEDYFDILAAIRFEAEYMDQARAETFYDQLKDMWQADLASPRSYVNYQEVEITMEGALVFAEASRKPGPALLRTINQVACYARKPALKVR